MPLRTTYWLMQEGGRILGADIAGLTKDGVLRDLVVSHRERKKEIWFLFSAPTASPAFKLTCLGQLGDEDDRFLGFMERLGLVAGKPAPGVSVGVVVNNNPSEKPKELSEQEGEALARAIVSARQDQRNRIRETDAP